MEEAYGNKRTSLVAINNTSKNSYITGRNSITDININLQKCANFFGQKKS